MFLPIPGDWKLFSVWSATASLQPVNAPGGSLRTGQKTTCCGMDTSKINGCLAGAPLNAVYSTCGNQVQGPCR